MYTERCNKHNTVCEVEKINLKERCKLCKQEQLNKILGKTINHIKETGAGDYIVITDDFHLFL